MMDSFEKILDAMAKADTPTEKMAVVRMVHGMPETERLEIQSRAAHEGMSILLAILLKLTNAVNEHFASIYGDTSEETLLRITREHPSLARAMAHATEAIEIMAKAADVGSMLRRIDELG